MENDDTEHKKALAHWRGQENLDQGSLGRDGDDETKKVVVVTKNTKESIENDDLTEVVGIETDTKDRNNLPRGRTLMKALRRSRQSPYSVRPQSPLRVRRSSGAGSSSTASPTLRRITVSRTPARRTTSKQVATNSGLLHEGAAE